MSCDHDDSWNSDKVEKSIKKILEEKVDLVYCNAEQINEKGEVIQKDYFKYKKHAFKRKYLMNACLNVLIAIVVLYESFV